MHPKITTYSSMMSDNFRLRDETRIGIETEAAALAAMRCTNSHLKTMKLVMQAFTEKIRTG
jgi:DNA-binding FadR family transcriptional regulator